MKFSYQWIQDFVPGLDAPAKALEQLITVRTAECDGIETVGALLEGGRLAIVLSAEPVPGTHITKALVDIGAAEPITVACGAPNCREGLRTIWVPLGTKTIQGVESNGMLASAVELGIGKDASGIVEWPEDAIYLQPDQIIEIDNKSLTHRPDLWGHQGMAREVAAITRNDMTDPVDLSLLPGNANGLTVCVDDRDLCPRFSAVMFENVKVGPSPWWLQYRLLAVGINPINNVVDITNYVAAELAQPMHAFDRDKLRGGRLIVRTAHVDEPLPALNDAVYALSPSDGVVADEGGAVSIAGIIGGRDSAISESTTNIVFESANWNANRIRKTSTALKLRTDASMRFEKAQDPANTVRALARAIDLMRTVCPAARLTGGLTDIYEAAPPPKKIHLNLGVLARKLGREIPAHQVRDILERLAFQVHESEAHHFVVTVPSWRATKDIAVADDLVEEVGRMIGYDTITPTPPMVACTVPPDDPRRLWHRELRALMTARGFTEVYNYSFLSDVQAQRFGLIPDDQVRVVNPIASDQNLLRSSLIPGIFANLELNAKHFAAFRLFEIGREIHRQTPAMPREITHLAAAQYGSDGAAALFELKRIAEAIAPRTRVVPVSDTAGYEHPARTAKVMVGDTEIGRLFEAHPSMLDAAIDGRAVILDLNLDAIENLPSIFVKQYTPIRRYPSISFDLTILAREREMAMDVEEALRGMAREAAGGLLQAVAYKWEFRTPTARSMTFEFVFRAADRTLSSQEITPVRDYVIGKMRELAYEMRV